MHGLSVMNLARAAGLSLRMMSKIENGIISLQALLRRVSVE
jgi:transcriptional regulator with XRE-family HTH domain